MASKGVTKTGEAFCMSCGATVDAGSVRCESCYSQLEEEVRAFRCPRCETVLELGTQQCPKCSMRFMVKTVRPSDASEDDKILSKLIDWGRSPSDTAVDHASEETPETTPSLTPEESEAVSQVLAQLAELADLRAEVASGMGTRLSEARERISRMMDSGPGELPVEELRSELASIAQDMARIDEVLTRGRELADQVARTFAMTGPAGIADGQTVSLDLPRPRDMAQLTPDDFAEREEQVRKREEMVDRKIKAYAQKKKQLDAIEAELEARTGGPLPALEPDERTLDLEKQVETLSSRIRAIHETISAEGACDDPEACLSSLQEHLSRLVTERSALEQASAQLEEGEEEIRQLLKALDGLLGQLPSEIIDNFSKTDEFKLYERVLDRLKI